MIYFSSNNGPSPVSQNILLPPPPPLRLSAPRPHTIPRPPVIRHPKLRRSPQGPYPPIQTPCITLDNQDGGGEAGRLVIAEEPSEFEDDGNGERRITTNFNEGVTARCNECGRTFPMDSFRNNILSLFDTYPLPFPPTPPPPFQIPLTFPNQI